MPLLITGMEHQFSHVHVVTWYCIQVKTYLFGNWEYLTVKMYLQDRLYSGGFESGNLTR